MLFTWDTENLCIVFRQWRVTSTPSLLFSLIVVILLGVGYEGLRSICRRYELSLDKQIESIPRKLFLTRPPQCPIVAMSEYAVNVFFPSCCLLFLQKKDLAKALSALLETKVKTRTTLLLGTLLRQHLSSPQGRTRPMPRRELI